MSHSTTDGSDATAQDGAPTGAPRRRPPLWLLILAGALVVALVVVAVVVLGNRGEDHEIPVAETVTLSVPTPTIDPVAREAGTAFLDSLPSTLLAYSLTEVAEHPPLLADGALEGYRLVYSDGGGTDLIVLAGQWRDAASAQAVLDRVVAAQPAAGTVVTVEPGAATEAADDQATDETASEAGDASAEPTAEAPSFEVVQGSVEVDGTQVGTYLIVPHADGTGTAWWTNGTVLIQVDGPAAALRDFYAAFPL
jgi:hypothetical protein